MKARTTASRTTRTASRCGRTRRCCEQAGVDVPTNWDELRKRRKQTHERQDPPGIAMSAVKSEEGTFQWLPFLWAAGADLDSLDSDGGRQALQLWVDFVKLRPDVAAASSTGTRLRCCSSSRTNRAALMVNGPWQIPTLKADKPDLKYQVATLPQGQTAPRRSSAARTSPSPRRPRTSTPPGSSSSGPRSRANLNDLHRHPRLYLSGTAVAEQRSGPRTRRSRCSSSSCRRRGRARTARSTRRSAPRSRTCSSPALTGDATRRRGGQDRVRQGRRAVEDVTGSPPLSSLLQARAAAPRPAARQWRRKGAPYLYVVPGAAVPARARAVPDRLQHPQQPSLDLNVGTFLGNDAPFVGLDNYLFVLDDDSIPALGRGVAELHRRGIVPQFRSLALALFLARPFTGSGRQRAAGRTSGFCPAS